MGASKPTSSCVNSIQFAKLEPRIKNISQATIRKKWKPLPVSSQERVREILLNLKTKRSGAGGLDRVPAVGRTRSAATRKANLATTVKEREYERIVEEVADKLLSRLPRMPFPPTTSTQADDSPFNLSNTLHRIRELQSQLTTNVQSAHLLRRQIQREKKALKRDRAELAGLEAALKSNEALKRKRGRTLHPLARDLDDEVDEVEMEEFERLNAVAGIAAGRSRGVVSHDQNGALHPPNSGVMDLDGDPDPELEPLLKQLRSHLLSMQNNTASMRSVVAAMEDTKTALDQFVAMRLDKGTLRRLDGLEG
ncbi:uncharacterized protein Z518_09258 [Rhinocladiella mackenziei CBS 650.93]|uniref:Rhinocladiella mackenziei CBS 650.93 unplaced genomic scaffold supercont1.7, whole genome shotgun sequence n=1 Tax=Rhinocladiella mackenziei CBS 650.93 TaxID=1442369 RepID=A0A0D2FHV2_9EURO|nr:uncharacterized protein Z518_09258 [Rhinocladiella mackenziei CBS 650.93]KIX01532.1 hypothetical protein Z518_09258 [Rhinocladiella mackenziei CBS 650.93]